MDLAVDAYPPDNRRRDLDNLLKCLLDSFTFGGLYRDDSAFQTAYFGNTPLALFVSDGQDTAHGLDADFSTTAFTLEQPLEEAVSVSITAKPTASTRAPTWV